MTTTRILAIVFFVLVLGGTLGYSRTSDLGILYKAGKKAKSQIGNVLPDSQKLTDRFTALRVTEGLTLEERVQVRISADHAMQGVTVTVSSSGNSVVKLRGVVATTAQRNRAQELATTTHGVVSVINELAVPEGQ